MKIWRRKRYSGAVVGLLTVIFIGVGTVLATLATSVLRPLPFARPAELFRALAVYNGGVDLWALEDFRRTASRVPEIAELAVMTPMERHAVEFRGDTTSAGVTVTSANFFRTLGIPTRAYGAPGSAIVSQRLIRRLGLSREAAIGKSIRVGADLLTIVDVLDRTRSFPAEGDVWFAADRPGAPWMGILRTRQAMHVNAVGDRMSSAYQTLERDKGYVRVTVMPLAQSARPAMARAQRMLVAGIGMFAIIAILNYGLLGIADARRRAQEFAVRVAVGGTRAQVMWGLFRDQLLLVGVALLLAITVLVPIGLRFYDANELAKSVLELEPQILTALVGTFALLVLAAALPTRVSTNTSEIEVLRRVHARASRVEALWNRAFVSVQFGVTSFLVVVGVVALLGVLRDRKATYGFDPNDAMAGRVSLTESRRDAAASSLVASALAEQVEQAFPGRATVWTTSWRAMSGAKYKFAQEPGQAPSHFKVGQGMYPWMSQDIRPNFFEVVGIRIVRGRAFHKTDDATSEPVAILTEKAARNLWGTTDVIGHRIRFGEEDGAWRKIVGVAADAYPVDQTAFAWQSRGMTWPMSFAYRPLAQTGAPSGFRVMVRSGDSASVSATLETLLGRVAPGEAFQTLLPLRRFLDWYDAVGSGESTSRILFAFAVCGLLLGLAGAMILIDDVVRSRTAEFGIRRALGAPAASLVALASRETVLAGTCGVLIGGLVGARFGAVVTVWLKATVMGRVIPQSGMTWPLMAAIVAGLLAILIGGTMLRALRAARLDPATALRTE